MEINVTNPELEQKLSDLARRSGRDADDLVQDVLAGYFEELAGLRNLLDGRYEDLKSGRAQPVDGEEAFKKLKAKSDEHRNGRA